MRGIIKVDNTISLSRQIFGEIRANEASSAGDNYLFQPVSHAKQVLVFYSPSNYKWAVDRSQY